MLYGLYVSASGVLSSSHRQDVLANNLANAETAGFKRDLSLFRHRLTEAQERRLPTSYSDPLWEKIGGGMLLSPTHTDHTQGAMEDTGNALDLAIEGEGFFTVRDGNETLLTRDGRLMVDRTGRLVTTTGKPVLGRNGSTIALDPTMPAQVTKEGAVVQAGEMMGQINVVAVADKGQLTKRGQSLFSHPSVSTLKSADSPIRSGVVEGSNVNPTTELVQLMETQRQLEANANMIRYQDQALAKLVNEVGKIA